MSISFDTSVCLIPQTNTIATYAENGLSMQLICGPFCADDGMLLVSMRQWVQLAACSLALDDSDWTLGEEDCQVVEYTDLPSTIQPHLSPVDMKTWFVTTKVVFGEPKTFEQFYASIACHLNSSHVLKCSPQRLENILRIGFISMLFEITPPHPCSVMGLSILDGTPLLWHMSSCDHHPISLSKQPQSLSRIVKCMFPSLQKQSLYPLLSATLLYWSRHLTPCLDAQERLESVWKHCLSSKTRRVLKARGRLSPENLAHRYRKWCYIFRHVSQ